MKWDPDFSRQSLAEFGISRYTNPVKRALAGTLNACGTLATITWSACITGLRISMETVRITVNSSSHAASENQGPLKKRVAEALIFAGTSLPQLRQEVKNLLCQAMEARPGATPGEHAFMVSDMLINRHALKSGVVGGITAAPGVLPFVGTVGTIVLATTADLVHLIRTQLELCYCMAFAFGLDPDEEELRAVSLALIGFSGSEEAAGKLGVQVLRRLVDRAAADKAAALLLKKIGLRNSGRLLRAMPLIGIPLGAATNLTSTMTLGKNAERYFSQSIS